MLLERASGILLHPTSLRSRGGVGDLGPAAYEFLDFLAAARQGLWQVLPLNPVSFNNSPYSSISAFAGNPLLISLERLAERGWIERARVDALPEAPGDVDFAAVKKTKLPLVREAARNFARQAAGADRARFEAFCRENAWWLEDFALFYALRRRFDYVAWNRWPQELARREVQALERVREEAADELAETRAVQFAFWEQWRALHRACRRRGVRMVGDVAIFVNFDGADAWAHPEIFRLGPKLEPDVVSGVPPDAFSRTGQLWGNPLYRWEALKSRGYDWWVARMRWAVAHCDLIRLDHFRGFESCWEIPAGERTAVNGRWVRGPGEDLFQALGAALGDLPFIAEDLGFITPEVNALRDRLAIPGMKVLQFGFGDPGAHIYLPHRFPANCAVYTGTHDNDTTAGWWQNGAAEYDRRHVRAYLGEPADGIHWAFLRAAAGSPAALAVAPLQDVLGLGSEARMNVPSRVDGNWAWRVARGALTPALAEKLALLAEVTDRHESVAKAAAAASGEPEQDFAA